MQIFDKNKVQLVIAGSAKSGTTTLFALFEHHPLVCGATMKEPRFFTDVPKNELYFREGNYNKGANWLWDLFPEREKFKLEASTIYFIAPDAPELLYRHNPDMKLIFLLRHPVKRFYSHYWQEIKTGVVSGSFEDLFETKNQRLERYYESSRYEKHLSRFFARFPKENIRVLIAEEFFKNSDQAMDELCPFVGLPSFEKAPSVYKNKASVPRSKFLNATIRALKGKRKQLNAFLPKALTKRMASAFWKVNKINQKEGAYPPMPKKYETLVQAEFDAEIAFVERLLGREIPAWKAKK